MISLQSGSHIRLTADAPTEHHVTIPAHADLRLGTLRAILVAVAEHRSLSLEDLVATLFS